jgi:hypothetical protein
MPSIHPQMQSVLQKSSTLVAPYSITEIPLHQARELYAQERMFWNTGGPNIPSIMETEVKGPVGEFQSGFINRIQRSVYQCWFICTEEDLLWEISTRTTASCANLLFVLVVL